jgi:putative hydrolase of HD superfamily
MNSFLKQIEFIKEIDKLKYIERKTKLINSSRQENDAEHSWHLAMMAMVLAEHSNTKIDLLKVIKMVLIHDIVEIDSGDIFIFDTENNHDNTKEELKAAKRIFGMLPKKQAEDLVALWYEFEKGESNEAKFAKAMDRFEPILQNVSNNGGTWREYNVSKDKVIDKTLPVSYGSKMVWNYSLKEIESIFKEL